MSKAMLRLEHTISKLNLADLALLIRIIEEAKIKRRQKEWNRDKKKLK